MNRIPAAVEGDELDLHVGAPAHGGHCVARVGGPHGQVVFVRHALPGERVVARVTEVHRGYLRADAVRMLRASPDRVTAPCPYAGPGGCGGCDLQHVAPPAQREWKATVIRDLLHRIGGLSVDEVDRLEVRVEELPGGGLGWRSRVRYAVDAGGRAGLLRHRSHQVVPVERCLITRPEIQALPVTSRAWDGADAVEVVASTGGDVAVRALAGGRLLAGEGPERVVEHAVGRSWTVPVEGFWQVHPAAADTLAGAVLELSRPRAGESVWDLYAGAGLFAAAVAGAVGPGGRVTAVESSAVGVAAARENLADLRQVRVVRARVDQALRRRMVRAPVDLVVLDPPRSGAGAGVVRALAAAGPRAVAYVACDPAAFSRDVRGFGELGWRLVGLRACDLFPMTAHVECVGLLAPR